MSRLNDLIRQVALTNEALAADLQREVSALADRRSFGLNFERHVPETVELPGRPVRRGDKVRILPPRGQTPTAADEKLWQVDRIDRSGEKPVADLVGLADASETATAAVEDLVVVAEFRDPIYPGLVSTGKVERGGDKPFNIVSNTEPTRCPAAGQGLVAASLDLAGGHEAGVDRVAELGDDDQVLDGSRCGLGGVGESNELGDRLLAGAVDPVDLPQLLVCRLRHLSAGRQDAHLVASAHGTARQFNRLGDVALEVQAERAPVGQGRHLALQVCG